MLMSQILKSVDFTKTQKSRYFEYEKLKGVLQERKTSKFRYKWYLQKISGQVTWRGKSSQKGQLRKWQLKDEWLNTSSKIS